MKNTNMTVDANPVGTRERKWPALLRRIAVELTVILALLGFAPKSLALLQGIDCYVGTETSGDPLGALWTWNINGNQATGHYGYFCGFMAAGDILRSHAHFDLDIKPDTGYKGSITAEADICDAFVTIFPPGCYDLYIKDPITGGGFRKNNSYPNWRSGYVLERFPNDSLYNTKAFSFEFFIDPNANALPAANWIVANKQGIATCKVPKRRHYPIANDGASTATATVVNTTNSVTFAIVGNPLGCTLTNTTKGAVFTASTNEGTVEVFAITTDPNPCLITNFWFDVMGSECQSCDSGAKCDVYTGVDSVNIKYNLGPSRQGAGEAFLQVRADLPSQALGSPQSIQYNFLRPDFVVFTNSQGCLRQVMAVDRILDIVTNTATSYLVNFYRHTDILALSDTTGLYVFTNTPYRTVLVSLPGGDTNHLQVSDSANASADYYWTNNAWTMVTGGGLRNESVATTTNGSTYTKTRTVKNALGAIDYQSSELWQNFSYGTRLLRRTIGSGPLMQTETNSYTSNGLLQQSTHADGSWDIYAYDSSGRQIGHYSPFLNSPPTTNAALCRYTASSYDTNLVSGSSDAGALEPYTPRMVVDYVLGNEVRRSYTVLLPGQEYDYECASPGAAWNNTSNRVTITYSYQDALNLGRPSQVVRPDGTVQLFTYDNSATCPMPGVDSPCDKTTVWTGVPTNIPAYTDPYTGALVPASIGVMDGTMDETWTDPMQRTVLHRVTDVASQIIVAQDKMYYDDRSRLTNTVTLNRLSASQSYDCCNLASTTAPDGTVTSYGYDALKRRVLTSQNGITTSNILNANGDLLGTLRFGTDGSVVTNNLSTYTDGGQLIASTDGLGNTTAYTNYFDGTGQLIKVTTYPDLSTRIETYAMDGSLVKVAGTAVLPALRYAYGVESEGGTLRPYRQEIKLDANGADTAEWTKTYTDLLGRDYKTVYASATGAPASQSFYNVAGQLVRQMDPDGVTTLYQYNLRGEPAWNAVDVNTNGQIDFAGTDRISYSVSDVVTNGYNLYASRTRTYVWNTAGANSSNLVSTAMTSMDGMQSWNVLYNNGVALTNSSSTVIDPTTGTVTVTAVAPDRSTTVTTSVYGRQQSIVRADANGAPLGRTDYGYDPQGRQNTVTDARNGTTTTFFNAADQPTAVRTPSPDGVQPGQLTTNLLDNLGRVWKTILTDGACVTNLFATFGAVTNNFGARTYPTANGYDYAGRMKTLTTWTNFAAKSGAAVTTWNYDSYRGFLTNKTYADGKGPNYGYTLAGRLASRTWARGTNTSYGYNPAGDLSSVSYSDTTPGLTNGFDRLGRTIAITNGATVCTLAYNDAGQLLSESYAGGPLNGLSVTNGYDSRLRRTRTALLSGGVQIQATLYTYDAASRLATVSDGTNSATYTYLANSPLVGQIAFKQNSTVRLTTTKSYDFLNRLTAVQSSAGVTPAASFNYGYNLANQRTAVTNADSTAWNYQYDTLGQVTSGKKNWSDGTPVAGQQFTYGFDDIGNRRTTASGGDTGGNNLRTANYAVNSLNQYTSRDVPGYATVLGSANPNATVTVNLQRAARQGSYFWDELAVNNASSSLWLTLTNLAVLNNGTNADIVSTNIGNQFLAQTPEVFGYDLDGNMTNSGQWTITWDAENHALSFATIASAPTAAKRKVDCAYDYQGRRVQKIVATNNGSAWIPVSTNKFIYDGWNLIAILNADSSLQSSFQWGLDLSGSQQGAGGVGGLLSMTLYSGTNAGTYFYAHDGNGNVATLVNAANGNSAAQYEYDPFGALLRSTGLLAGSNPFQFSAKFYDVETSFNYYGYRYYSPNQGRWLIRDSITELGGKNLYAFVANNSIASVDGLGDIGLDTALDILALAADISAGAGAATIALDGAFLAVSFNPNPVGIPNPTGVRIISRILRGEKKTYQLVDHALLSAVAEEKGFNGIVWDDLASRPQHATLTLEYVGRRPNLAQNKYEKHFKYFAGDAKEAKASTLTGKKISQFAPGVDDAQVQTMINEALRHYRAGITIPPSINFPAGFPRPHTSFGILNGYVYDAGAPNNGTLGRFVIGYDHGECTTRIKLKIGRDGSVHAHPTIEEAYNPNRGWTPPTTNDDE